MIHRNICPICGSENPEGSVVCQVCKANLQNLPDDMFPADPTPSVNAKSPDVSGEDYTSEEMNLDKPVPFWLQSKLQKTEKSEKTEKVDFESFADALFGMQDSSRPQAASAGKSKSRKPRKTEPVYQPTLGNLIDSPLVEPDGNQADTEPKNVPGIVDFSNIRPVKKWDDPKQDASAEEVKKQSDKAFQTTAIQVPLWWQQDAPLVESDEPDGSGKSADEDDPALINSVSPAKVLDPSEVSEDDLVKLMASSQSVNSDDYQPDSGSLLSDLMNEINSNSVTLTPAENRARDNGTVFYTGNREKPEEPAHEVPEIIPQEEETLSSAEALDQILRGMGYQTEDEIAENNLTETQENPADDGNQESEDSEKPDKESVEPALADSSDEDPLLSQSMISVKEDLLEEPDIPWDLFGSQDMTLPQSPEETEYRAFSRRGLPSDQDSTTYQQRMMSSILEKIIYAENFVPARKSPNERAVSFSARLFWSLIALGGIILIMMTGITDKIIIPSVLETSDTQTFLQAVDDVKGNALVVVDYTPAYGAELDAAAGKLIDNLADHAKKVYLGTLNPAAMPIVQQMLTEHKERVEFTGWWPAGVISIRARLAAGEIPDQVWLITSESGAVRDWAEQLAVSAETRSLHVLGSGQLEPMLGSYLTSGLVKSAMSRDQDLLRFSGSGDNLERAQIAVLYLTALLPLAWLGGIAAGFLKSDPNYVRKKNRKPEALQPVTEKEDPNDRRL